MSNTVQYPNVKAELARYDSNTAELADYLNMSRQNVNGKLNGSVTLNAKDMILIREFFLVKYGGAFTLDYLFSNELDKSKSS